MGCSRLRSLFLVWSFERYKCKVFQFDALVPQAYARRFVPSELMYYSALRLPRCLHRASQPHHTSLPRNPIMPHSRAIQRVVLALSAACVNRTLHPALIFCFYVQRCKIKRRSVAWTCASYTLWRIVPAGDTTNPNARKQES